MYNKGQRISRTNWILPNFAQGPRPNSRQKSQDWGESLQLQLSIAINQIQASDEKAKHDINRGNSAVPNTPIRLNH